MVELLATGSYLSGFVDTGRMDYKDHEVLGVQQVPVAAWVEMG